METKYKVFHDLETKIDKNEKSITHIITSNTIDRDGDIVEPSGIRYDNYRKNPIVLFMHNQYMPIGKNLWLKPVKEGDREYVLAKTKISEKSELAQDIFNLYEEKILNAWSIGFIPDYNKIDKIELENKMIFVYKEWELLEYSAVSIPANPDAITTAIKIVKSPELRERFEIEELKQKLLDIKNFDSEISQIQKEIKEIKDLIKSDNYDDIKILQEAIIELNQKFVILEQKLLKNSTEIAGNSVDLNKVIKEAVAGAISRIKGDIK